MTTIVFNGEEMACDGRVTIGNQIVTDVDKKIVDTLVHVIGSAGDARLCDIFVDMISKGATPITIQKRFCDICGENEFDFESIVYNRQTTNAHYYVINQSHVDCIMLDPDRPFAIGSGAPYALGSMMASSTPWIAVGVAAMFDNDTGPVSQVIKL